MTLTIELPEPVERRLAEQAAKDGKTVEALARELIEKAVTLPAEKTFREIMAPFAEEFAAELQAKAVTYINTDLYMRGRFDGGGTPSLRDFLVEVARDVPSVSGPGSVHDAWRTEAWQRLPEAARPAGGFVTFDVELAALGSGADFVAFQDFLGLPTLQMEFDFEGSYGAYHSNYDSRDYVERWSDPGFVGAGWASILLVTLASLVPFPIGYLISLGV